MNSKVIYDDGACILYDPNCLSQPAARRFTASGWQHSELLGSEHAGRGNAWFVGDSDAGYVLRHYCRGGLPGRISRDSYCYFGMERTRSFCEWRLLKHLYEQSLPVPQPVGASFRRRFGLWYEADLLTHRLPGVQSLAQRFVLHSLSDDIWLEVGRTLRRFHDHSVYHADLNAHNIQINDAGVWLIDFDKGALRAGQNWKQANLARLARSMRKLIADENEASAFQLNWKMLLRGYA